MFRIVAAYVHSVNVRIRWAQKVQLTLADSLS